MTALALVALLAAGALATNKPQERTVRTPGGTDHVTVFVPEGPFAMGMDEGEKDEAPAHIVRLEGFYIDKYEVTNFQYMAFINTRPAGAEPPDSMLLSLSDSDLQIKRAGDQYELKSNTVAQRPVVEVPWVGARVYCAWAGGRLPTEAEWEKGARGEDGRTFPWGEGISRQRANYKGLFNQPIEVGHYGDGASPYGALDMAGNVWEWVADWYDSSYYNRSPEHNPGGPAEGSFRTIKGGAWGTDGRYLRSSYRYGIAPHWSDDSIGFRCAWKP